MFGYVYRHFLIVCNWGEENNTAGICWVEDRDTAKILQ